MASPELQLTADGSHTLYIPAMEEHYHSVNGARQESHHVFIEAGFRHFLSRDEDKLPASVSILELGFGTGLNALLTLLEAEERKTPVLYTTLEKFPLDTVLTDCLNYGDAFPGGKERFRQLHRAGWNTPVSLTPYFTLQKIEADFNDYSFPSTYDLIYYDAFAPDKQSEVWNQPLFNSLFSAANPGAVLTTYCAKGAVRRMMQQAGFRVERIPGPPGKREMLRATKPLD